MSFNLNTVMLAGNLTRDPQSRFLANETQVTEFGLAINRQWKDKDGNKKEEVTFIDIEVWGKLAALVQQYCTKGKPVFLQGRLKLESWEDKETGAKRSKIKVIADSVQFLGSKPQEGEAEEPAAPKSKPLPQSNRSAAPTGNYVDDGQPPFYRSELELTN